MPGRARPNLDAERVHVLRRTVQHPCHHREIAVRAMLLAERYMHVNADPRIRVDDRHLIEGVRNREARDVVSLVVLQAENKCAFARESGDGAFYILERRGTPFTSLR